MPYSIIAMESDQKISEFNISNVKPSDFEIRMLASALYGEALKFYADPENMKAFEKWKAERDKEK